MNICHNSSFFCGVSERLIMTDIFIFNYDKVKDKGKGKGKGL